MKTFKSINDVEQLRDHPLHATIKSLVSTIIAVWLPNNQFGLDFLIPDKTWLPCDVRRHLEAHLEP